MWTLIKSKEALDLALAEAKGSYQRNFLLGIENLSGSSLRGKAGTFRGKYAVSRNNLLSRLSQKGIPFCEARGPHNSRILVIG